MKLLSAPSSALKKGDQTPRESRLEESYILEDKNIDGLERIEYYSKFHLRRISPIVPSSISWSKLARHSATIDSKVVFEKAMQSSLSRKCSTSFISS